MYWKNEVEHSCKRLSEMLRSTSETVLQYISGVYAAQVVVYCSDIFCASWAAEPFGIITEHEWLISLHNKPLSQPGCVIVAVETPRPHDTDLKHFYIEILDWIIFGV